MRSKQAQQLKSRGPNVSGTKCSTIYLHSCRQGVPYHSRRNKREEGRWIMMNDIKVIESFI